MPLLRSQSSSWSQSFLYLDRQVWGSSNRRTRTLAPLHQLGTWSYGNNSIQRRTAAGLSNTTSSHTRTSTTNSVVGTTIDFFQYAICPFCNKTKAFLNYAGVKYNAIEVNPLTKAEIRWSTDYRKVPLARALLFVNAKEENDDDINNNKNNKSVVVWKGSDEIIHGLLQQDWVKQKLQEKWQSSSTTTTSDKNQIPTTTPADDDSATSKTKRTTMTCKEFGPESESSQYWVTYANQELAVLLYPNLCPTLYDSYQAFAYINDDTNQFSYWQKLSIRLVGSLAMYLAASRVKRTYHNKDFTHFLVVVSIEFILVVLDVLVWVYGRMCVGACVGACVGVGVGGWVGCYYLLGRLILHPYALLHKRVHARSRRVCARGLGYDGIQHCPDHLFSILQQIFNLTRLKASLSSILVFGQIPA